MGIEHKESLQECQTSPEGMPLTWAREHGIDTRIRGFVTRSYPKTSLMSKRAQAM
jgi:hypothetical protein